MDFSKMMIVLKHEFKQKLRSKLFRFFTLLGPLFFLGLFLIPMLASHLNQSDMRTIAVVDETGKLGEYFIHPDSAHRAELGKNVTFKLVAPGTVPMDTLRNQVTRDELAGILEIHANALTEQSKSSATLRLKNTNDFEASRAIETIYKDGIRRERFRSQGIDVGLMSQIQDIPDVETLKVSAGNADAKDNGGTFAAGYLTGFIIYMSTILYGTTIMRSVVEEKSSRIVEVIVSSIRPYELLLGKVLGNACAAFLQVSVWAVILALMATVGVKYAEAFMGSAIQLGVSPFLFVYFVLYFIFGFLIFATLYAMVGASVDQDSDTQQASLPITLLVIVPIFTLTSVLQAPSSSTSVIMSLIPFFSPVLMMGRIFGETPPAWQIGLSFVLMALTFFGVLWVAARIYRVGILMYGKRFSFGEMMKWVRYN